MYPISSLKSTQETSASTPPARAQLSANSASALFRRQPSAAAAASQAARKVAHCQAWVRGRMVRRLNRAEVNTADVRRAVGRVNTDCVGFCQLLLYLVFVSLTCALLRMQYSVRRSGPRGDGCARRGPSARAQPRCGASR